MITTMPSDRKGPPPRVEVITSVQRRRRWPTAEKIRLVEETMQSGMSFSYAARRAGVAPSWTVLSTSYFQRDGAGY
jgi:transposase